MTIMLNREKFVRALEEVKPGLAGKDILQQSAAFLFKGGRVWTFNDETMASAPSGLPKESVGAVPAKMLMNFVRKADDETLKVTETDSELQIAGGKWRCGIAREATIMVNLDKVTKPAKDEWVPVAPELCEAITLVEQCAGKDLQQFVFTCVHIHPEYVEASDNDQLARMRFKTKVSEPVLIKRDCLKVIPTYDISHMAVHDNWMHFRSRSGAVISIVRYADQFHDLSAMLTGKGMIPVTLPKSLTSLVERAKDVSDESDLDRVKVTLLPGRAMVAAKADGAWFQAGQKAKYKGPKFTFLISPKMLLNLIDRYPECVIDMANYRLHAVGGSFKYAACVDATLTNEPPAKEE